MSPDLRSPVRYCGSYCDAAKLDKERLGRPSKILEVAGACGFNENPKTLQPVHNMAK